MNEPEVSRRLKAARWLRGGVDSNGKPGALSRAELARHPVLVGNRITENRLHEIEQIKTTVRIVELIALEEALELPRWFEGLAESKPAKVGEWWARLLAAADQAASQGEGASRPAPGDTDPPDQAAEGGGT